MAAMPPITGIRVSIQPAGSSSGLNVPGAGHEYINLDFANGSTLTLQAGPSGALGTGDLVEQNYATTGTASITLSTPSVNNTGYNILNAYDNYAANTADAPVAYSADTADGFNSNSFVNALLLAAGISSSAVNNINGSLSNASGLDSIGAGAGADLSGDGVFGDDDGSGDTGGPGREVFN